MREVESGAVVARHLLVAVVLVAARDAVERSGLITVAMATDVVDATVLLGNALFVDEDAVSACVDAVRGATPGVTCNRIKNASNAQRRRTQP